MNFKSLILTKGEVVAIIKMPEGIFINEISGGGGCGGSVKSRSDLRLPQAAGPNEIRPRSRRTADPFGGHRPLILTPLRRI